MRLTILLLFISSSLFAQSDSGFVKLSATSENFTRVMDITDPSVGEVRTIIHLSINYSYTDEDTCLILGKRAVEVSKTLANQFVHATALLELGDSYRIFGDPDEGETYIQEGKILFESLGDKGQVAYANNKLGAVHSDKGDNETAIHYYLLALETWENLKDTQNIFKPYLNIGWIFQSLGRLEKAEAYTIKALEIAELLKDDRSKIYALNNLALIQSKIAINYRTMADTIPLKRELFRDSTKFFIDQAFNNHGYSLALARKLNDNQSVIRSIINMAELKDSQGEYSEAIKLGTEAETLAKALGDNRLIIINQKNLAKAYRHTGQLNKAVEYGEAALKRAEDHNMEGHRSTVSGQLYQAYKELGKFEKALENHEIYKNYIQKNGDVQRNKAIAEVEAKYQTVQKEKQILEQKNDILQLETAHSNIEKQRNYVIGGALIFGILGFFGYQLNKTRRERNDKIAFAEALIFAQEEERKRIARDLHDGIGQSLLLIKKQMESTHETTLENQEMITATLEEVRSISRDLHPFQLEKFGLTAAINEAIHKVGTSTDLFISTEIEPINNLLSDKAEINVYRTIQEALNNIVKHADASAAKVRIQAVDKEVVITIQDNGKGFDPVLSLQKPKSLGLRTMQERIVAIGGKLKMGNNSPNGTIIEFSIPITGK